jgi:hypothetical protein
MKTGRDLRVPPFFDCCVLYNVEGSPLKGEAVPMAEEHSAPTHDDKLAELNRTQAEREHAREHEHIRSLNEAAMQNANIALRAVLLINGGAAVAILAFIGSLATSARAQVQVNLPDLVSPLVWFAGGVAAAALGCVLAYCTNYSATASLLNKEHSHEHPYVHETGASKRWRKANICFHAAALVAAVVALVLFFCGVFSAQDAILASQ